MHDQGFSSSAIRGVFISNHMARAPQDHHPDDAHPVDHNEDYHGLYADGFSTPATFEHAPYDADQGRVVIKFKVIRAAVLDPITYVCAP